MIELRRVTKVNENHILESQPSAPTQVDGPQRHNIFGTPTYVEMV